MPNTCPRCTGIILDDENFYALQNFGYMISSKCLGCDFFLEVAKIHEIDVKNELQTQILLRRCSKDSNLVDVWYVRMNGSSLSLTGLHQFRICAAYGMFMTTSNNTQSLEFNFEGAKASSYRSGPTLKVRTTDTWDGV
jgi:hypothetical protein